MLIHFTLMFTVGSDICVVFGASSDFNWAACWCLTAVFQSSPPCFLWVGTGCFVAPFNFCSL